ncbi:MAG: phosphatidylserine decarboxylase [bacterium]|nr:phosphatidylserine decarboxylase [bacterium]
MKKHFTSYISQNFGRFASRSFSPVLQRFINSAYVGIMGLDMSEFSPPSHYKSLNALFTRKLLKPRPFSPDDHDFIAPCDSLVTEFGNLESTKALQIKGMSYCVKALLGDQFDDIAKKSVEHGQFINFYLSPRDYHRYHIPTDLQLLKAVHIPGKLYPVNMPSLNKRVDLFIENERVILECLTRAKKRFYMVLVGALNVGKMQLSFESRIKTNADALSVSSYLYEDLHLKKGDDFGCFEMGSTIVIISEPGMFDLSLDRDQKVSFGQTIARVK